MKIDISLAGWLLALASFLVGTILPVIYRRVSFNGFLIKNIASDRLVIQMDEKIGTGNFYVLLILRYLNANQTSMLVEDVSLSLPLLNGADLELVGSSHEYVKDKEINILNSEKLKSEKNPLTQFISALPMIVKANEDRNYGHLFEIRSNTKDSSKLFGDYILKNGLKINAKVNGKLRRYKFRIDYV